MPEQIKSNKERLEGRDRRVAAERWRGRFALVFGSVLGLALLKFGNPVVLDRLVEPPGNTWEWLFQPWPARWGYLLLLGCVVLGLRGFQPRTNAPKWVLVLPGVWLLWQGLSAARSIAPELSEPTLIHFLFCVLCFYAGVFCLPQSTHPQGFRLGLLCGLSLVLWMGFEQHYGGLDATRKFFYEQPNWQQFPPEYLKKIQSNRIFSTLVYPNALATAILLLLPLALVTTWNLTKRLTNPSRAVIVGVLGYAALACLYWSGSKSGWLIGLVLVLASLLRQPFSRRIKGVVVSLLLVLGLTGFFLKYSPYFRRGAPSVSARFQYWKAAAQTALERPVFGTGPGTFSVAYRKIIPPGAEMAQLAHNDYLEQASDSGIVGLLTYLAWVLGSVILLPLTRPISRRPDLFAAWLGVLGWSLQSFVEFPVYIPAMGWSAFALLGWLWSAGVANNEFDSPAGP